jgi:hypothetical protein
VPDIFGLEASELASLGAKRFHGKPPLIGLGVHRHSGGGRLQAFAIIRFLFGRALRPIIADLRAEGAPNLSQFAAGLNRRGIPTSRGGTWSATQVRRVLERAGGVGASG